MTKKMDLLRNDEILEALVQEFESYSKELSDASTSLDEGYGVPFFSKICRRRASHHVPLVGMGNVNTGIWEAMLGSEELEILRLKGFRMFRRFLKIIKTFLDCYKISKNYIILLFFLSMIGMPLFL